jgi:hypothetical protein
MPVGAPLRLREDIVVTFKSASVGLALLLTGIFGALAQNGPIPGSSQQPPDEQQAPADRPPEQPGKKPDCVTSNTGFKEKGKAATFEIELQNTCDMRLKCTIDALVIGSRGQAQGHGTLILAAAPNGQTTRKTYVMAVRSLGGMANVSHSCKAI